MSDNNNFLNPENKREHYRVCYPLSYRPVLEIGVATYEVIDLSEKGVKFKFSSRETVSPGTRINAFITFRDGKSLEIEGEIIRVDIEFATAVLKLEESIPWERILNEQRLLKEMNPEFLKK